MHYVLFVLKPAGKLSLSSTRIYLLCQLYCYGWPLTVELVPMLGLNNGFILVALASAITIAYAILTMPKIRQYRLISAVVMVAIFSMTWVVKPKEIAYQSQTARFEQLLKKLNLSDGLGKIRDDIDFVERLENMPKSELKDWEELDNVTFYMVRHIALDSYVEDPYKERHEIFKQRYGEKSEELVTLNIYGDHISINSQVISDRKTTIEFLWESIDVTPYKKWFVYRSLDLIVQRFRLI